jgi:hypothetical protein
MRIGTVIIYNKHFFCYLNFKILYFRSVSLMSISSLLPAEPLMPLSQGTLDAGDFIRVEETEAKESISFIEQSIVDRDEKTRKEMKESRAELNKVEHICKEKDRQKTANETDTSKRACKK